MTYVVIQLIYSIYVLKQLQITYDFYFTARIDYDKNGKPFVDYRNKR